MRLWRQKRKKIAKITDVCNLEYEGREASKLISSISAPKQSSVCLSVSLCLADLFVCYFPAVVRITAQNCDGMEAVF